MITGISVQKSYAQKISLWFVVAAFLLLGVLRFSMAVPQEPVQATMLDAVSALERILEEEISVDDRRWLISTWSDIGTRTPALLIDWIESLIVAEKLTNSGIDPLAFVRIRHRVIDELYCNSLESTDPDTHRLRRFVAPDIRVLVADCVADAVVTPFDISSIAQSNARVGELVGRSIDATKSEDAIREALSHEFATMDIESQQRLLWGEFRASALSVFLVSADRNAQNELIELAHKTYTQTNDIAATALVVEKWALQRLDNVTVVARKDKQMLTRSSVATLIRYLEFVTGARLTPIQRFDVTSRIIRQFKKDPVSTNQQVVETENWMNSGYAYGHDPKLGRIRSWTVEEKAQMRRDRAAAIYCEHSSTLATEDRQYLDSLFGHDPVIELDCDNKTLVRESDLTVAKDKDYILTRAALDAHRQAFELIFDITFTQDEAQWFDEAAISDTNNQRIGLTQAIDEFQRIVADIQKPASVGPNMNEYWREDYAVRIYCTNRNSDNKHVVRLIQIINSHDPIKYEICERTVVIRESDIEGRVKILNFLRALGGRPPLTDNQKNELIESIEWYSKNKANGPLNYRSENTKFSYWWKKMPISVRRQIAEGVREKAVKLEDYFNLRSELSAKAANQLGLLALCNHAISQLRHRTQMSQLESRTIFNMNTYADSPWVNPEAIDDALDQFAIFAPFVKQQCERVWK